MKKRLLTIFLTMAALMALLAFTASAETTSEKQYSIHTSSSNVWVQSTAAAGEEVSYSISVFNINSSSNGYETLDEVILTTKSGVTTVLPQFGTFTMPAEDVTLSYTTKAAEFSIEVEYHSGIAVTLSSSTAKAGEIVTVAISTDNKWHSWDSIEGSYCDINGFFHDFSLTQSSSDGTYSFTMPAANVQLFVMVNDPFDVDCKSANDSLGSHATIYNSSTESRSCTAPGSTVTVTISFNALSYGNNIPPDHVYPYQLASDPIATTDSGIQIPLTLVEKNKKEAKYTFTMPEENVTFSYKSEPIFLDVYGTGGYYYDLPVYWESSP